MKVLQIITRINRGGTARWLQTLHEGLTVNGIESLLMAGYVSPGEEEDDLFSQSKAIRIKNLQREISIKKDFLAFFEIRHQIKKIKPDIVNTHTSKAGLLGRLAVATIFFNKPRIIHTFHGHILYGYFGDTKQKLIVLIEKYLNFITNQFIVSGETVRNELLEFQIGKLEKYVLVRPGVKKIEFLDQKIARFNLGLSEFKIIVGWMGRLEPIKRPDRVLTLAKHLPDVLFIIAGEGNLKENLKKEAPSNAIFVNWSPPELVWGASDIALLTSDNEAQPLVLIEASLAGLPLLAMDVGAVKEVVVNNTTGFLCKNESDLKNYLDILIQNQDTRKRFGVEAQKFAEINFSSDQFLKVHLDLYKKSENK